MTFTQIVAAVLAHCNLTSTEAVTRVGASVNRHYKRVTSTLGLDPTRFVTRSVAMTVGVRTVTFTEIEKIDRVIDTTDSTAINPLTPVSQDAQRTTQPGTSAPTTWSLQSTTSSNCIILTDTVPQSAYSLQADGWATLADLAGSDEPAIPESFHDILTFSVIAEELLKKEKPALAREFASGDEENPGRAENLLRQLRFHLVDNIPTQQASRPGSSSVGGSGGGGGTVGGTAYTQTALLTFDLGSGIAPFAVAQANAAVVTNLDADKLDGQHGSFYLDRANHTGAIASTALTLSATDRLIGRDTASGGASEEISVTGGIEFTGSQSIRTTAFTGDVTKSAGGTALTIANDAVTYAKQQNVSAASKLLGRGSAGGAGDPEEITLGTGLSMSATTLNATAVAGSDTQVQFNDGGVAAGDAGLTFNKTTDVLSVGAGVGFPASQSAQAGANVLDDYEEGTWTPADGSGAALSFTNVVAQYVKIGQLVMAAFSVTYPSTASGSSAVISGLPFTSQTVSQLIYTAHISSSVADIFANVSSNATTATITSAAGAVANSTLSTVQIRCTLMYRASA